MRTMVRRWLDRDFVFITGEAPSAPTAADEMKALVAEMEAELEIHGLTLADTVRTRLWAKDRPSRDEASRERRRIFDGPARSVSSSFIAPSALSSESAVAMDLVAMRSSAPKQLVEYEPPIVPLRYFVQDSIVFLSGVTAVLPGLEYQVKDIVGRVTESLAHAQTSWDRVALVSCYLHRSQSVDALQSLLRPMIPANIPAVEYEFADGYSEPGKLLEIETTALGNVIR